MFHADLSWTDDGVERLGERRHRKAREKAVTPSSSVLSTSRPSTSPSLVDQQKIGRPWITWSTKLSNNIRFPLFGKNQQIDNARPLNPLYATEAWQLDGVKSVFSRASRPLEHVENMQASKCATASTSSVVGYEYPLEATGVDTVVRELPQSFCKSYNHVKNTIMAMQAMKQDSQETSPQLPTASSTEESSNTQPDIEANLRCDSEAIYYNTARMFSPKQARIVTCRSANSNRSFRSMHSRNLSPESIPSRGTCASDTPSSSVSAQQDLGSTWSQHEAQASSYSHVLRLIQRMRTATSRLIIDRLREEWQHSCDSTIRDEMQLEKLLWVLVASEHPLLDSFCKPGYVSSMPQATSWLSTDEDICKTLYIDGSIAELYFASSSCTKSQIIHLAAVKSSDESSIPLPNGVIKHQLPDLAYPTAIPGVLSGGVGSRKWSLPCESSSSDYIKSSKLATLLPVPQLLPLFVDCHRALKPGGKLDLRIVDAIPDRDTTGPRLGGWLKSNLLIHLDRDIRCHRPCNVLPMCAAQAGFVMPHQKEISLIKRIAVPAAFDLETHDEASIMASIVLRELWKDTWGAYVGKKGLYRWWWLDRDILEECIRWNTTWNIGWLEVIKQEKHE